MPGKYFSKPNFLRKNIVAIFTKLFCLSIHKDVDGDLYYEHTKLLQDLFQNYDKTSRPSPGSVYPVNVTLGIAVAQLVKVVSISKPFKFDLFLTYPVSHTTIVDNRGESHKIFEN